MIKNNIIILAVTFFLQCCASVPRETVDLSIELGNQISYIEDSHIALLNKYFTEKRNQIDLFIMNEWTPLFAKNFFSSPEIENAWDEVISSNDMNERLDFIVTIGPVLQRKINSKRHELIKPLEDLEKTIERKIRQAYNRAYAVNNSLTSFLVSASELTENRDRYINMLGISDSEITNAINSADSAVDELLSITKSVDEKVKAAEVYKNQIEKIINQL
ncbi:MAG: hypothetical protein ABFS12_11005 [Bacteroidota bacterium]